VRPPFLNEKYTCLGDSRAEQHRQSAIEPMGLNKPSTYALSASSGNSTNTDSTLKGDTARMPGVMPERLAFALTRVYDGTPQPLTEHAVKALDKETLASRCTADVSAWLQGDTCAVPLQHTIDLSISMARAPHTRSHATTHNTGSSWTFVSPCRSLVDRTAENVCAAGLQFDDISAPYGAGSSLRLDDGIFD
jgi:hypothetical protein